MEKFIFIILLGVTAVTLLDCVAAKTVHVVGDSMGWTIPTSGGAGAYDTWAASKKFVVGDVLTFNFANNAHDVLQVPKASYDGCSSSNPIGSLITRGPANITLNSAGNQYFICTFSQHCQLGQKLAITVSATPGSSPSPTGNPTTPTTTPTAPSPNSGTPADCVPAPTSGPTAGGPTDSGTTTSRPNILDSSSPVVLASAMISLLAIVMQGLFF